MGNILTALKSEKETTLRRREKEYTSPFSYQYNTGPTILVENPRSEEKELPQLPKTSQVSTKRSTRVLREPTTLDPFSHQYNTGPTILVANPRPEEKELPQLPQLPKTSQVTTKRSSRVLIEPTALDPWLILEAKAQVIKQEKISKVKENTTSLPHRSYSSTTVKSEKKTISKVKENTISLPRRSYSSTTVKSEKKTTSGIVEKNDVTLLDNFGNLTVSNRDYVKKVTEIVRHILRNTQFVGVFGNWSCRHWPLSCDNEDEWQIQLDRVSLLKYLKLTPEKKHDFFNRSCRECGEENMISSFFLCKKLPIFVDRAVEIICHLEWNNHYRVFAYWECQRLQHTYGHGQQQHTWKSSYTWISLQKFIEKASTDDFDRTDFYKQKCHECRDMCSKCKDKPKQYRGCTKCDYEGVITKYDCLVLSEGGGPPHKRWLCAKCQEGAICVRTDDNRPVRRNRNILLS